MNSCKRCSTSVVVDIPFHQEEVEVTYCPFCGTRLVEPLY